MLQITKPQETKTVKPARKVYVAPRLLIHGDVAQLTNDRHKPHHQGNGPESELS